MQRHSSITAFFAGAALFAAAAAFAQPADAPHIALTVDDAVQMAMENNITVARNKITLEASERAKSHSWNSVSPSLSITGGVSAPDGIGDGGDVSDYTLSLRGSLSLSFSPNLFTSIKSARLSYEQGEISYEQACRTVELNVRQAFYGLLYEKENITVQERNLQTAKEQYEQNRAKYNQGRMSELDVLSAEVKYKTLEPTVESAYVTFHNDLASFKQLLGMDVHTVADLSGSLEDVLPAGEVSLDGVTVNSPALSSLQKQLEVARVSLTSARFSAYAPSLTASWQHGLIPASGEHIAQSSQLDQAGTVSLTATIPLDGLLPWSSRADGVASAQDKIADLELQLKDAETSLSVSTESSLRKIRQSQSSIKSKQANVELAQRSYDMTLQAYNRGVKDLLSLQDASDNLLSAQMSLKNEQRTLVNAVLELENTIGVPFGTLVNKKAE